MDVVNPRQTDGIFPRQVEQPVSAAPAPLSGTETPSAPMAPAAVENPTTPNTAVQTPDVASTPPQAPKIDLGAPIEVETPTSPEPTVLPEQPKQEVSPAEAIKGSFTAGEHGVLEETVAQTPIDETTSNIGDVSTADTVGKFAPAQPAVEQPIEPAQPPETPAPVSSVGPVEDVGEAAPPPFIITPEESVPEPAEIVPPAETTTPSEPITPIDRVTTAPVVPAAIVEEPITSPSNVAEKVNPPVTPEELAKIKKDFLDIIDKIDERTGELRAAVAEKLDRAA